MRRLITRLAFAEKWHHAVGPRVFKIIDKNKERSTECIVKYCSELKFEVRTMYND